MKPFNWEIGEVPEGWSRDGGRPLLYNASFDAGPWAAMGPPAVIVTGYDMADNLCTYQFHYEQRHKVRAWLDWFMTEFDE